MPKLPAGVVWACYSGYVNSWSGQNGNVCCREAAVCIMTTASGFRGVEHLSTPSAFSWAALFHDAAGALW